MALVIFDSTATGAGGTEAVTQQPLILGGFRMTRLFGIVRFRRPLRLRARWACGVLCSSVLLGATSQANEESTAGNRALLLHRQAIVVDGHNDVTTFILDYGFDLGMDGSGPEKRDPTPYWIPVIRWLLPKPSAGQLRMDTDLRRLRAGGVDAQFFSIFVDKGYVPRAPSEGGRAKRRALDMIAALNEQVRLHPADLELATSTADVRRIASQGKIAALMGLEGGHAIEDDLGNLREFYRLGIRYMTLTWSNANNWADSCYERRHGGLTDFGLRPRGRS